MREILLRLFTASFFLVLLALHCAVKNCLRPLVFLRPELGRGRHILNKVPFPEALLSATIVLKVLLDYISMLDVKMILGLFFLLTASVALPADPNRQWYYGMYQQDPRIAQAESFLLDDAQSSTSTSSSSVYAQGWNDSQQTSGCDYQQYENSAYASGSYYEHPSTTPMQTFNDLGTLSFESLSGDRLARIIALMTHYGGKRVQGNIDWLQSRLQQCLTDEKVRILLDPNSRVEDVVSIASEVVMSNDGPYNVSLIDVMHTLISHGLSERSASRYLSDMKKSDEMKGKPASEIYMNCVALYNLKHPKKRILLTNHRPWSP